jgi:hypothetical protein
MGCKLKHFGSLGVVATEFNALGKFFTEICPGVGVTEKNL